MEGVPEPKGPAVKSRRAISLRVAAAVLTLLAVGLCVRALVQEWSTIGPALAAADLRSITLAVAVGGAGLWGLAVQWWCALRVFGAHPTLGAATRWFFAGELGKYLPGGIWPVLGRGELAHRGGVSRSIAYATTLVCLGLMCVGAAVACVLVAPFALTGAGAPGAALAILFLIPLGLVAVHPRVFGWVLGVLGRMTKGRVALPTPSWGRMIGLIGVSVPTWLLVGVAAWLTAAALGFEYQPARVVLAAIVAWIVGILVIPVPAGAGVRELVFAAVCGLSFGQAVAVAAVSRLGYIGFDLVAGVTSLALLRGRRGGSARSSAITMDETTTDQTRTDQTRTEEDGPGRSARLAEQN